MNEMHELGLLGLLSQASPYVPEELRDAIEIGMENSDLVERVERRLNRLDFVTANGTNSFESAAAGPDDRPFLQSSMPPHDDEAVGVAGPDFDLSLLSNVVAVRMVKTPEGFQYEGRRTCSNEWFILFTSDQRHRYVQIFARKSNITRQKGDYKGYPIFTNTTRSHRPDDRHIVTIRVGEVIASPASISA